MACLETFKSTDLSFLVRCDAIGKLEMQESAKLLHLYYYRNCLCLITRECNIFMACQLNLTAVRNTHE